jgi:hypothetical protein
MIKEKGKEKARIEGISAKVGIVKIDAERKVNCSRQRYRKLI